MRLNNNIRYRIAFISLAITAGTGCKRLTGSHLPPKTMEQVLFDVSLAESYSTMARDNNHIQGAKNTDSLATYYKQVFEHYNITEDEFAESMTWYKSHPDDLDSVYNKVLIRAAKLQAEKMAQPIK